jgi:hypothetical protein
MPVSKPNRKAKKTKKVKGYRPVRALPGYQLVKETCQKISDILFEAVKLTKMSEMLAPSLSPLEQSNVRENLRKIIVALSPSQVTAEDGTITDIPAFAVRTANIEREADKIAERAHGDDLMFFDLVNQAEFQFSYLITNLGEPMSILADLCDRHAEALVNLAITKEKEKSDVEHA